MPTLSKEQQDKAVQWLKTHWNSPMRCEICQHGNWQVLDDVITPALFSGGFNIGTAYPQFMVMCKNCGLTKYFNAIHSGIIEKKNEPPK